LFLDVACGNAGPQHIQQLAIDSQLPNPANDSMRFEKIASSFAKTAGFKSTFEKRSFLSPSNFAVPLMAAGHRLFKSDCQMSWMTAVRE
jgi:hypothetical protein